MIDYCTGDDIVEVLKNLSYQLPPQQARVLERVIEDLDAELVRLLEIEDEHIGMVERLMEKAA